MSEKVKAQHIARKAMLYVRQSSAYQVTHNLESQKLQYAMQDRLRQLGWREISPGDHTLRFELAGKNPASSGILLGVDSLSMESPVYTRSVKVDIRTLQKK